MPGHERMKDLVLAALLGAALTAGGHFLILGRNVVTRAELEQYVATNGPYAQDQRYILKRLDEIANGINRLPGIEQRLARVEARIEVGR